MDINSIKTLVGKENPIVLELGCNDGSDTKKFLNEFKDIKIYCFDPDDRAIKQFKANIFSVPSWVKKCELIETCLSDIDGEVDYYKCDGSLPRKKRNNWNKSSSIKKPKHHLTVHPWVTFNEPVKINSIKLDTWMHTHPEINMIDFIWADVQGAEENVIKGGIKTLQEKTKYLYTEHDPRELYEGGKNADYLVKILECFSIVKHINKENVLLKNNNFN